MGNLHVSFIFFQPFSSLTSIRRGKREYNKEKDKGRGEGEGVGGKGRGRERGGGSGGGERGGGEREKQECFHQVKVPEDNFSFLRGN